MRWLAVVLALAGSPLWALSCQAPDPVAEFLKHDALPDQWGAVVGRIDFDESRLPGGPLGPTGPDRGATLTAQLVGQSLGPDGFQKPFQVNVTLHVGCVGAWCGMPQSGRRYLVYLKKEGREHIVYADPCMQRMYLDPSRKTLDRVHGCFIGGPCVPDNPRR